MQHFKSFAKFIFFACALLFPAFVFGQSGVKTRQRLTPNSPAKAGGNKKTAVSPKPAATQFSNEILSAQIVLTGMGISCGSMDGLFGGQMRAALRAFQEREKLPVTGELDKATKARLKIPPAPPFREYVFTAEDAARLQLLPKTWLEKSQTERLDYETPLELVAEQNLSHPKLIQRLNPKIDWSVPLAVGASLRVPDVKPAASQEKAALIKVSLTKKILQVFSSDNKLLAHFPCSIGARVEKRPVGKLEVVNFAQNPNYTFDPINFPESEEARQLNKKLILPPGANNPVGTAWIGLSLPGYGVHGTPLPEQVGRTESHGCFRLTNWDVSHLIKLVKVGTPVVVES